MSLTHSLGAYQETGLFLEGDKTKRYIDILQTSGSGATQGVMKIVGSATASNDFHLTYISIHCTNPTSTAVAVVYLATMTLYTFPTASVDYFSAYYGPVGLVGCTTTTHTVSVITSGGTATVNWIVQGYKRK